MSNSTYFATFSIVYFFPSQWGSRGPEFESQHSDQESPEIVRFQGFLLCFALKKFRVAFLPCPLTRTLTRMAPIGMEAAVFPSIQEISKK